MVTGGAGYIGAHTCKLLAASNFEPISYDNLSTGYAEFVKWGPLEIGELHDIQKLSRVLTHYKPVCVIHFAAKAYVGESVADPFKYYRNNVGGTLALLEAMLSSGIRNIVFSSTCATYGLPVTQRIDESHAQSPINPYGYTKLMIERILGDLSAKGDISQISLRYFNAAGADKTGEIGEKHDPETHLIPLAIQSAFGGKTLEVFGTDFPTPDGTAIRDYIHVEDLGRAHILAVEKILSGWKSDFINLGTGEGNSVREVIASLNKLGVIVHAKDTSRREGDPAYLVADASRAKRVLGWRPEYKEIGEVLKTAINWYKKSTDQQ
jgi:UDP-glucose-4-epimerase GalE